MTSRTSRVGRSSTPWPVARLPATPRDGAGEGGDGSRDGWVVALTPCDALRADLDAAGLPEPLPADESARWEAWLQVATVFDRLRRLPRRHRAAHAARTGPVWALAREVSGEARFEAVAEVMAAWPARGEAPALPAFRELLWGMEQVEAAGATRLALSGLAALAALVPVGDLRAGYAIAQRGRALRTIGAVTEAARAFQDARQVGDRCADEWLVCRCLLGQGAIAHVRGNYPAAREAFSEVLKRSPAAPELVLGAHHGLLSAAVTARNFDQGLGHGIEAIRLTTAHPESRRETLCAIGTLCEEMGDARAARGAYELALRMAPRPHQRPFLLRTCLQLSMLLDEASTASEYAALLQTQLLHTHNPYDRAASLQVLGSWYSWGGNAASCREAAAAALAIAEERGYFEIAYKAADLLHQRTPAVHGEGARGRPTSELSSDLSASSLVLLTHLTDSSPHLACAAPSD